MPRATRKSNTPPAAKARSISNIYNELEKAYDAMKAAERLPEGALSEPAFNRLVKKVGRLAWQLVATRANTVEEMLLKIRVVGWCADAQYNTLAEYEHWTPSDVDPREEFSALASLRDDLRQLKRAA